MSNFVIALANFVLVLFLVLILLAMITAFLGAIVTVIVEVMDYWENKKNKGGLE